MRPVFNFPGLLLMPHVPFSDFSVWLSDENQLQLSVYILQNLDLFLSDLFFLLSISGHLCKLDLAS